MNRRSFFKSLAFLTGGIAAAPTIFAPKLIEVPKWKAPIEAVQFYPSWAECGLTREQILDEVMRAFKESFRMSLLDGESFINQRTLQIWNYNPNAA